MRDARKQGGYKSITQGGETTFLTGRNDVVASTISPSQRGGQINNAQIVNTAVSQGLDSRQTGQLMGLAQQKNAQNSMFSNQRMASSPMEQSYNDRFLSNTPRDAVGSSSLGKESYLLTGRRTATLFGGMSVGSEVTRQSKTYGPIGM